jgi:hypothetical protein
MKKTAFILSKSILKSGETPDLALVPPAAKRRLSPIQKIYCSLASKAERAPAASTVFASRDGEDFLTRQIVEAFHEDGSVSPHKFSASVYNAAPGLWSVHTRNNANYTAVVAREDSLEAGLLESLTGALPSLFVYAEETDGGYGAALFFDSGDGEKVTVDFTADVLAEPISFDGLVAFLEGKSAVLAGRYLRLEKTTGE